MEMQSSFEVARIIAAALDAHLCGNRYELTLGRLVENGRYPNMASATGVMTALHITLREMLAPLATQDYPDERAHPAWVRAQDFCAQYCEYTSDQADRLIRLVLEKW